MIVKDPSANMGLEINEEAVYGTITESKYLNTLIKEAWSPDLEIATPSTLSPAGSTALDLSNSNGSSVQTTTCSLPVSEPTECPDIENDLVSISTASCHYDSDGCLVPPYRWPNLKSDNRFVRGDDDLDSEIGFYSDARCLSRHDSFGFLFPPVGQHVMSQWSSPSYYGEVLDYHTGSEYCITMASSERSGKSSGKGSVGGMTENQIRASLTHHETDIDESAPLKNPKKRKTKLHCVFWGIAIIVILVLILVVAIVVSLLLCGCDEKTVDSSSTSTTTYSSFQVGDDTYVLHANMNCYDGAGGASMDVPGVRTQPLWDDYYSSAEMCGQACGRYEKCRGFVWRKDWGACYLRVQVLIEGQKCQTGESMSDFITGKCTGPGCGKGSGDTTTTTPSSTPSN